MNPPRIALWLLRVVPASLREAIAGDLIEDWQSHRSRLRFWNLTLRSIASCARDGLRPGPTTSQTHSLRGDGPMQSLVHDIRFGARLLMRSPAFTLAAVATLALGIGANSAIFSIVNVLSLKPLPYQAPARVAFLLGWDTAEGEMRFSMRQADLIDLQRDARSFEAIAGYSYLSANLTGGDVPDRVQAYRVTPNTFELLGVPAATGRTFALTTERDDVAVISHALWQRRFGGDPAIVGRRIDVNGTPHEIIGVMPRQFEFPVFNFKGDIWLPWRMQDAGRGEPAALGSATLVGRLRDGVSYEEAQSEVDVLMLGYADRFPESNRTLGARVVEMGRLDDEDAAPVLSILLATVAMVLLLACSNVANLLLARGAGRQRELAVRAAVGASRLRIGRQLLIESALLAVGGGVAGIALAIVGVDALKAALPEIVFTTVPHINELGMDRTTLAYALVLTLFASMLFGVLPAWRASRDCFDDALKDGASAGGSRRSRRWRSMLIVAEVALATILVIVSGLLTQSYYRLHQFHPGFNPAGVMTMAISLPDYKYKDSSHQRRFFETLLDRASGLPGVTSVGLVNVLPFSSYDRGTRVIIEGDAAPEPRREPSAAFRVASPDYFEALNIPLISGRVFGSIDRDGGLPVAIVNTQFVERFLGDREPVGRRLRLGANAPWVTIVGVVGDVHHTSLTARPQPEIYRPFAQAPSATMMLAARSVARPDDLAGPLQAIVYSIDSAQPVYHVKTLQMLVDETISPQRMAAAAVLLFGAVALVLAGIGIYSVISYGVSQQTREFGVRMALGATPGDVMGLVLKSGGTLVGAGIVLGLAGALAMSQLLRGILIGVTPGDPATYVGVALVLGAGGLIACAVPASRASSMRPVTALRAE